MKKLTELTGCFNVTNPTIGGIARQVTKLNPLDFVARQIAFFLQADLTPSDFFFFLFGSHFCKDFPQILVFPAVFDKIHRAQKKHGIRVFMEVSNKLVSWVKNLFVGLTTYLGLIIHKSIY